MQLILLLAAALLTSDASLEARFADPPGDCRLLPIRHDCPRSAETNIAEIARLRDRGFGGFAGNVPFGSPGRGGPYYVENEAAWPSFTAGLASARASNMALWLYDELGYPSLSAGDLVLRGHPELEQTGWLVATASVKGGETVTLDVPPGKFVAAFAAETDAAGNLAVGPFVDVSAAVRDERPLPEPFATARTKPFDAAGRPRLGLAKTRGEIRTGPFVWTVPAGANRRVYVITEDYLYEGTHPECKGMKLKFRYPNPLVKAATERFCEVNHGAYARHLGNDLGKFFTATFTDEPSLMGNWWRRMPYFVFSSAPGLAERYRARTGSDLIADIPYLVTDSADANATSGAKRIAFWDESARMYEEAFFKPISDWCRAHGFRSGGHLMGEETFAFHVSHYGDFFRCLKALDAPSIDCLTSIPSNVSYLAALFAGSARELTGATHTMVEVSSHMETAGRKVRYLVNENEIQGTLNRLVWGGINTYTSYYGWDRFSDEQTRAINRRLGRAVTLLLRDGHSVADVAVFYPAKDAMRVYRPQTLVWDDKGQPIRELQRIFDNVTKSLYEDGRVFLFIDEETVEKARVERDELVIGKLRFKVVVLPGVETLSEKARQTLASFEKAGGKVIRAEAQTDVAAVVRAELEPHVDVRRTWAGRPRPAFEKHDFAEGAGRGRPAHGEERVESPIRVSHRRTKEGDVFFVMNDSSEPFEGNLRFCGAPVDLTVWDLDNGTHFAAPRMPDGAVKVSLAPYRALVFTSQTVCTPRRLPAREASVHDISVKPGDDLQGVIAAIAEARRSGVAPSGTLVRVMFSGGDYRLSASLNLDGACSDTLWRAAPGARVRLVGGVPVEARRFTPVADPAVLARLPKERTAPVFVADVSALLPGALRRNPDVLRAAPVPPHFYANGRLMQEARWPNEGWTSFARAVETGAPPRGTGELEARRWKWTPGVFIYGNPRAARWDFADGVLLNGYWTHDWDNETRRAAAWETRGTNRVIRFASPGTYGTGVGTWGLKERRFYAVDLLEELDAPGEWYLDRARKLLYAVPRNGQSLSAADEPFLATLAEPLLVCRASRCRFENLVFAYGAGRGADVSADDVVFSNCTFTALGGDGMRLSGNRNLVTHCRFAELGGGGLAVSGGDRARLRRADTVVEDTTVRSWGRYRRCYAGACNLEGCGIVVRRNEFFDAPHMAMRYEGNEILIESNRIHHVVLETNDAGAIYSGRDWTTAGNVLRGNFIHHLGNPASAGDNGVMALYFDDCDCGDDVIGNVFWKVPRGIMIGGGREHPVRGNLFVECALGYSIDNRGMTWKNWNVPGTSWHLEGRAERLRYREEPWRSRYPWLANIMNDDPQEPKNDPVEENVFVDCREVCRLPSGPKGEKAFSNLVMRANLVIRTRGASGGCKVPDARPQVAAGFRVIDGTPEKPYDPGFVDAANGDFRLRPDAPLRTAVR